MGDDDKFHPFTWCTGDLNWEDYGGVWYRLIGNRAFHFIEWSPDEESDKGVGYVQLVEVDLMALPQKNIRDALRCCGYVIAEDGVVNDYDGAVVASWDDTSAMDLLIADCCRTYGCRAPLSDAHGKAKVRMIRAAIRESKQATASADAHDAAMARPVNRLGSTAAEFMRGDIGSAINRGKEAGDKAAKFLHRVYTTPGMGTLGGTPAIDVIYPHPTHENLTPWETKWRKGGQ